MRLTTLLAFGLLTSACLPSGSFVVPGQKPSSDWRDRVVVWAELDGLQGADAVLWIPGSESHAGLFQVVTRNESDWVVAASSPFPGEAELTGRPYASVSAVDLDGDGVDTILVTGDAGSQVSVWLLDVEDGRLVDRIYGAAPWGYVEPADVDSDGIAEIVGIQPGGCCNPTISYALAADYEGVYNYTLLEPESALQVLAGVYATGTTPSTSFLEALRSWTYYAEPSWPAALAGPLQAHLSQASTTREREAILELALLNPDEKVTRALARHALREWQSPAAAARLLPALNETPELLEAVAFELEGPGGRFGPITQRVLSEAYDAPGGYEATLAALFDSLPVDARARLYLYASRMSIWQPTTEIRQLVSETDGASLAALTAEPSRQDEAMPPEQAELLLAAWRKQPAQNQASFAYYLPRSASPALYDTLADTSRSKLRAALLSNIDYHQLRPDQQQDLRSRTRTTTDRWELLSLHQVLANGLDDPTEVARQAGDSRLIAPYANRLEALGTPREQTYRLVTDAFEDPEVEDLGSVLWLLPEAPGGPDRLRDLVTGHPDPELRMSALYYLDPQTDTPLLTEVATGSENEMMRDAALSMLVHGPPEASEAFEIALAQDTEDATRLLTLTDFMWTASLEDAVWDLWQPDAPGFCDRVGSVGWQLIERGLISAPRALVDAEDACGMGGIHELWTGWLYSKRTAGLSAEEHDLLDALESHPDRRARALGEWSRVTMDTAY